MKYLSFIFLIVLSGCGTEPDISGIECKEWVNSRFLYFEKKPTIPVFEIGGDVIMNFRNPLRKKFKENVKYDLCVSDEIIISSDLSNF